MARPRAHYERQSLNRETRRYYDDPRIVLMVDRGLKSGKLDEFNLSPADARALAVELLVSAERHDGRSLSAAL